MTTMTESRPFSVTARLEVRVGSVSTAHALTLESAQMITDAEVHALFARLRAECSTPSGATEESEPK